MLDDIVLISVTNAIDCPVWLSNGKKILHCLLRKYGKWSWRHYIVFLLFCNMFL